MQQHNQGIGQAANSNLQTNSRIIDQSSNLKQQKPKSPHQNQMNSRNDQNAQKSGKQIDKNSHQSSKHVTQGNISFQTKTKSGGNQNQQRVASEQVRQSTQIQHKQLPLNLQSLIQNTQNATGGNNKQQIIIVSSTGGGIPKMPIQGQPSQPSVSNLQGGGQALSMSGLSAQQLAQILQAYGVINNQNQQGVNKKPANPNQASSNQQQQQQDILQQIQSLTNQPSSGGAQNQGGQTSPTNIIVVSTSGGQSGLNGVLNNLGLQQSAQPQQTQQQVNPNQQSLGQSLQAQIQQLHQQNQMMQQQILANAAQSARMGNNPTANLPYLASQQQQISDNELLLQNLTNQLRQHQKQQMQQQQINNLQRQINQMRSNQQQILKNAALIDQTSSQQFQNNPNQQNLQNQASQEQTSSSPSKKSNFDPNHINIRVVNNANDVQSVRHSSAHTTNPGSQMKDQSAKKQLIKKANTGIQSNNPNEQNSVSKAKYSSKAKKSTKQDLDNHQMFNSSDQKYFKKRSKQQQRDHHNEESDIHSGTMSRQYYQSATQRQNQGVPGGSNQQNYHVQSPSASHQNIQDVLNKKGQTKNMTTTKKSKKAPQKMNTTPVIEENFQHEKARTSNNNTANKSKNNQQPEINSSPRQKEKNKASNHLQLPPQAPSAQEIQRKKDIVLSAKEKKREIQRQKLEKERVEMEKKFKVSDLYISRMKLEKQKSFVSRNNAIIVYHQHRLVKLDINKTPALTAQFGEPASAVPKSAAPSVGAIVKPLMISPESLHDFYNHSKVQYFSNICRALEVIEEPKKIFDWDQKKVDVKAHSIQERKIKEVLDTQLKEKRELEDPENLAKNPIIFPSGNIKDTTIFFNSRFESGNLREVEKVHEFEYNCYVNFDFNSSTHSQWYYFAVRNIGKGRQYKFNVMNLQKDESCYQIGMKPFVYSTKRNRENDTNQWRRACENVCYYKNKLRTKVRECAPDYEYDEDNIPCYEYEDEASQMTYLNTLSFCYEFDYADDVTFFAYFQPYTLSDLDDYLFSIHKQYEPEHLQSIYKQETMCETAGGNPCYVLTITENVQDEDIKIINEDEINSPAFGSKDLNGPSSGRGGGASGRNKRNSKNLSNDIEEAENENSVLSGFQMMAKAENKVYDPSNPHQKQTIFLSSRVHPGESNASFMIQGAIDFLLQKNNKEARMLRETFIFKIIPMLNPDGVVNGHYRCNYIGADLNRRWPNPSKLLHPTIYYTKKLLKVCHQANQVLLFADFHGHTRKRNVFMYGCVSPQTEINQHKNNNLIRIVPYLLDQKNKLFSFPDCKFANEKEKDSTGRLVMFKEFGILNSYTVEATFYSCYHPNGNLTRGPGGGYCQRKRVNVEDEYQIKADELLTIGSDFCETIMAIVNSKILKRKFIVDTTTPLGTLNMQPGVGGNPLTQFFINSQKQKDQSQQQKDEQNSLQYNKDNNVQSAIKSFINGSNVNQAAYQIVNNSQTPNPALSSKMPNLATQGAVGSIEKKMIQKKQSENNLKNKIHAAPQSAHHVHQKSHIVHPQSFINTTPAKKEDNIDTRLYNSVKPIQIGNGNSQILDQEQMGRDENVNQQEQIEPKGAQSQKTVDHKKLSITQRKFKIIRDGANRDQTIEQLQTPQIIKRSQIDIGQGIVCNTAPLDQISRNSEQTLKMAVLNKGISAGGQQIITDQNHPMFLEHQYRVNQHEQTPIFTTVQNINVSETLLNSTQKKSQINIQNLNDQEEINSMGPEQMNIIDQYINAESTHNPSTEPNEQTQQNTSFDPKTPIRITDGDDTNISQKEIAVDQSLVIQSELSPHHSVNRGGHQLEFQNNIELQENLDQDEMVFNQQVYQQQIRSDSKQKKNMSKTDENFKDYQGTQFGQVGQVAESLAKMNPQKTNSSIIKQTAFQQSKQPTSFFTSNSSSQQKFKTPNISTSVRQQNNELIHPPDQTQLMKNKMTGLREQKSKSSLSVISNSQPQNPSNYTVLNTPNKTSNNINVMTPQQPHAYSGIQTQKIKSNVYKQSLIQSAPNNEYFNSSQSVLTSSMQAGQNTQNVMQLQKQNQLLEMQQRVLQQRKQQAEMQVQQISQNLMNARQSYTSTHFNTTGEIQYQNMNPPKRTLVKPTPDQSPYPYQKQYIEINQAIVASELKKPGSSGKNNQSSVLPEINKNDMNGVSRLTQNFIIDSAVRPGSQNKRDSAIGAHRNIMIGNKNLAQSNGYQASGNMSCQNHSISGKSQGNPFTYGASSQSVHGQPLYNIHDHNSQVAYGNNSYLTPGKPKSSNNVIGGKMSEERKAEFDSSDC